MLLDRAIELVDCPPMADGELADMGFEDLRIVLLWSQFTYKVAITEAASDRVLDVIIDWHDEVFVELVGKDKKFLKRVLTGYYTPPQGWKYKDQYVGLALTHSES